MQENQYEGIISGRSDQNNPFSKSCRKEVEMLEVLNSLPIGFYATLSVLVVCYFRYKTTKLMIDNCKKLSDKQVASISKMTSKVIGIKFPHKK